MTDDNGIDKPVEGPGTPGAGGTKGADADGAKDSGSALALGIALGAAFGAALGVALDNLSMGVGLGIAVGVVLGIGIQERRRRSKS